MAYVILTSDADGKETVLTAVGTEHDAWCRINAERRLGRPAWLKGQARHPEAVASDSPPEPVTYVRSLESVPCTRTEAEADQGQRCLHSRCQKWEAYRRWSDAHPDSFGGPKLIVRTEHGWGVRLPEGEDA